MDKYLWWGTGVILLCFLWKGIETHYRTMGRYRIYRDRDGEYFIKKRHGMFWIRVGNICHGAMGSTWKELYAFKSVERAEKYIEVMMDNENKADKKKEERKRKRIELIKEI